MLSSAHSAILLLAHVGRISLSLRPQGGNIPPINQANQCYASRMFRYSYRVRCAYQNVNYYIKQTGTHSIPYLNT